MDDTGTLKATTPARRVLRSIGAVLAGLLAIFVLSTATDLALHATGVFPPWNERMSDALLLLESSGEVARGRYRQLKLKEIFHG